MLKHGAGIRTFAYGGLANQPMSFTSFQGGQVYSLDSLVRDLDSVYVAFDQDAPRPFRLIDARLSFTIREAYTDANSIVPGEFEWNPADVHLLNTEQLDFNPGAVWKVVAGYFKK